MQEGWQRSRAERYERLPRLHLVAAATRIAGKTWPHWSDLGRFGGLPDLGVPGVWLLLVFVNGFGEEVGWRGFALPHLRKNRDLVRSALILAVPWAVTRHPSADWVVQQLREAFPQAAQYRYAILDHDSIFNGDVIAFLEATGLKAKRTSIHAPWQNGTAERWIGSCRREILDHIIPVNEEHLRRVIRDYVCYYLEDRVHDSLSKDSPCRRPIESRPTTGASLTALPRLGGLHHWYTWRQAA